MTAARNSARRVDRTASLATTGQPIPLRGPLQPRGGRQPRRNMHVRHDDDVFAHQPIEDRIRESSNESPSSTSVHDRIACWIRVDRAQCSPRRVEELAAQPGSSVFVPPIRRLNVRRGGRPKDQIHPGSRIRRTTSSHGIPVGPSRSRSSRRRSSSARWASVSGTASGVSQRLSQSSSTSCSRSAGVSLEISKAGLAIGAVSRGLPSTCKVPCVPWRGTWLEGPSVVRTKALQSRGAERTVPWRW